MDEKEKKSSEERGQFNLNFEESVMLRKRNADLRVAFDGILKRARDLLNSRRSNLSESDKDLLKEIREIASRNKR